jgi:signal transduction histidine kinase
MRLADFISANTVPIISEWEKFAKTMTPSGAHIGPSTIRDHIDQILDFIVADMNSTQTDAEQVEKSRGEKAEGRHPSAAEAHASLRYDGGFNMDQMVSEYRALRTSIIRLWKLSRTTVAMHDIDDLTRFNESIDQALMESIADYSNKMELSKGLFLGILGHDLRNPLSAISMSAELITRFGPLATRQTILLRQIAESSRRAHEIVDNLLDLTRARLGSGLPIVRQPMDFDLLARQIIDEMRAIHPHSAFEIAISGDVTGVWDKARIGQVLSNLIGNAVKYGFRSTPIKIRVEGNASEVILSVHNEGVPIGADVIGHIFHALTRGHPPDATTGDATPTNLGLGLFISQEIVTAHGGEIRVSSSEKDGTLFRTSFPRERNAPILPRVAAANGIAAESAIAMA